MIKNDLDLLKEITRHLHNLLSKDSVGPLVNNGYENGISCNIELTSDSDSDPAEIALNIALECEKIGPLSFVRLKIPAYVLKVQSLEVDNLFLIVIYSYDIRRFEEKKFIKCVFLPSGAN